MDEDMIDTFSNIPYTPAWYWKKFPGFFNVECYKILAAWDKGVRTEEECALQEENLVYEKEQEKEGNNTESVISKKRKTEK